MKDIERLYLIAWLNFFRVGSLSGIGLKLDGSFDVRSSGNGVKKTNSRCQELGGRLIVSAFGFLRMQQNLKFGYSD